MVWFSSSQTSNGILWSKLHKQVIVEIEEGDLKMASIMVGLLVFWSRILCPFVQKGQICLVSVISGHWISIHNLSNSKCRNPCIGLFRSSCRVFYSAAGMMGVKWASRFALTGTCLRNQRSTTCNSLIYEKRLLTTCVIIYMHSHTRFLYPWIIQAAFVVIHAKMERILRHYVRNDKWWHDPLNFLFADQKYHDEMIVSWWKIILILYIL